jgi:hypothetical protein
MTAATYTAKLGGAKTKPLKFNAVLRGYTYYRILPHASSLWLLWIDVCSSLDHSLTQPTIYIFAVPDISLGSEIYH